MNLSLERLKYFFACFLFAIIANNGFSEEIHVDSLSNSAVEVLAKYKHWLQKLSVLSYTSSELSSSTDLDGNAIPNRMFSTKTHIKYDRGNNRFFVDFHQYRYPLQSSKAQYTSTCSRGTLCSSTTSSGWSSQVDTYFHQINENIVTKKQTLFLYPEPIITSTLAGKRINGRDVFSDMYQIASYSDANNYPRAFGESLASFAGKSVLLFGSFNIGQKNILKDIDVTFQNLTIYLEKQNWQGNSVYQLIASDENGRYEIWLDPTLDNMPVKISYACAPNINRSNAKFFSFDVSVDDHLIQNGVFIPRKFTIVINGNYQWYENNKLNIIPTVQTVLGEISNVAIRPDLSENELRMSLQIPNYSVVSLQDVPQIDYVWLDGRIVPKTDEIALAIARGNHGFLPAPQEPRFWFMVLGLGLLLLGGGLKIRSMLKAA